MKTPLISGDLLYRKVFVGRDRELSQLKAAYDSLESGQNVLMMVVGEPGIGKTAMCTRLSDQVTLSGGKTLTGHCYEETSLSLPYIAFAEAIRLYIIEHNAEELHKLLDPWAGDLARIVPLIKEKLNVEPKTTGNPQEDRYRLLQAVNTFLSNIATAQPLLLILEDLHVADKETLEMLVYVMRNPGKRKLMIVGTYRDIEVNEDHPLSEILSGLQRDIIFGRVTLQGLNIDEVQHMLESITREELSRDLVEAVYRQSEGNPLFVQEVIRYLAENNLLVNHQNRMTVDHVPAGGLNTPEGLKDVIAGRISGIGKNCSRLLSAAAVIGIEFDLKILQAVSEMQENELLDAIEEAVRLSILEERPSAGQIRYRFTHAFFRRTLYDEMIAPKRSSLHQRIARILESLYTLRPEENAAELAEHFSQSTDPADLSKAMKYGELAAQQAAEIYAFSESARLLNRVLDVQRILEPENKEVRCRLLLQIGQSLVMAGELHHVLEVEVPAALSLAESISNKELITRVCLLALRSLFFRGYGEAMSSVEAVKWAERVNDTALQGTPERAWADFWLGFVKCTRGEQSAGVTLMEKSMEQARTLNDHELLGAASVQWIGFGLTPWSADQALKITSDDWRSATTPEWPLAAMGSFLSCGQRQQAEAVLAYIKDLTTLTGRIQSTVTIMTMDATMSYMDGKLEETVEILERILTDTQYADYREGASQHTMWVGLRPLLYLGFDTHTESVLGQTIVKILYSTAHVTPPLLEAYLGNYAKVNEMIDRMLLSRKDITSTNDKTQVWFDIAYLEAAVMAGHRPAVEKLLERLSGNTLSVVVLFWPTCIARQLGAATAFLDRYDEARDYYRQAINICMETGFRPELALTRLQLAELLLNHYPDGEKEALALLTSSVKDLDEMKMRPSLEHAFDIILSIGRKMYRRGELDKLIGLMSIMPDHTSTLLDTIRNEKETGIGNSGIPALFTHPPLLSQREIEVLRLIADGLSNQQIAEKLIISLNTVKTHISHIFGKLDTTDRLQTVKKARELRLL